MKEDEKKIREEKFEELKKKYKDDLVGFEWFYEKLYDAGYSIDHIEKRLLVVIEEEKQRKEQETERFDMSDYDFEDFEDLDVLDDIEQITPIKNDLQADSAYEQRNEAEETQEQMDQKEPEITEELRKPQPERITPKHMQAGWHMRSIEEMEIEAGLRAKPGAKKGPPQKIKLKDIRKHMQDDWQMESVEDMEYKAGLISKDELKAIKEEKEKAKEEAQKELARQEAKAEKSWKARFKKWHEKSKEIPMVERNPIAKAIVNQIEAAAVRDKGKDTMERD